MYLALDGKSKTIPAEFSDVQLCKAMRISYWELMDQPVKHVELFMMYLEMESRIMNKESKNIKNKGSRVRKGRRY